MAKQWLNLYTDQSGFSPASGFVTVTESIQALGFSVNLLETDRSGHVFLTREDVMSYGDPEVYLNIIFTDGTSKYLSAPLHTPFEVQNVQTLELSVVFLTGPAGTPYTALVNAHCVYEVIFSEIFRPIPIEVNP